MQRRTGVMLGVAIALLLLIGAAAVWLTFGWQRYGGAINAVGVDLAEPQAYVDSVSLSRLPRALVHAPVLRELLTEDFAFYYDDQEDRLSLRGAIKRIAFEHERTLADDLLEVALDKPAELAFWADAKGAPRHWLLAMTRGPLAAALQRLGTIASKDRQLTLIGEPRIGWHALPVYALQLSPRRTLALASRGDRVVVLSDPGLLFDADRRIDGRGAELIDTLLSDDGAARSPFRRRFGLAGGTGGTGGHTLVADGRLLSFGYRHFFPAIEALAVDLDADGARIATRLRLAPGGSPVVAPAAGASATAPWTVLPVDPAACTLLPLDGARVAAIFGRDTAASAPAAASAPESAAWAALARSLDGPAAACWYAASQLHTPLVVAHAAGTASAHVPTLDALVRWALPGAERMAGGGPERWQTGGVAPRGAAGQRGDSGERVENDKRGENGDGGGRRDRAMLARQGDWWFFSPDAALVERALDAAARRYPAIADALPANGAPAGTTIAVASPAMIAALAQRETRAAIGGSQPAFREAAERLLMPRLASFARLPPSRAVAAGPADAERWLAVDWQPLPPGAGR